MKPPTEMPPVKNATSHLKAEQGDLEAQKDTLLDLSFVCCQHRSGLFVSQSAYTEGPIIALREYLFLFHLAYDFAGSFAIFLGVYFHHIDTYIARFPASPRLHRF